MRETSYSDRRRPVRASSAATPVTTWWRRFLRRRSIWRASESVAGLPNISPSRATTVSAPTRQPSEGVAGAVSELGYGGADYVAGGRLAGVGPWLLAAGGLDGDGVQQAAGYLASPGRG